MNRLMKYTAVSLGAAVSISQCGAAFAASEMKNTEMVYVFQDAKGEVDKVIVSDWLSNPDGEDTYGQMECEESLPVEMEISYKLDGEGIEPDELVGKSGHITIRYEFENKQETEVETEKGAKNVFVPFVTITGMLLDNDKFTNVEISNGKIVNDGDHTAVIGVAFPGISDNMTLDRGKDGTVEIPDYVELEADVKDFSMEMSATYVSNALIKELPNSVLEEESEGNSFIQELVEIVTDLTDGTTELYEGADSINNGMNTLNEGIASLSTGLDTIAGNSEALTTGASQVFQSLLDTASAQLIEAGVEVPELTIDNYAEVLDTLLAQMTPENLTAQVTAAVAEQMRPQVAEQVIMSALNMSKEDYDGACAAGMVTEEQQTMIDQAIEDAMTNDEGVRTQLEAIVSEQLNTPELQEKLAAATAGYERISALKASLDSYQTFYQGVIDYTAGVDEAAVGAADLFEGSEQLAGGTADLFAGVATLEEGLNDTDIMSEITNIEYMLKAAGTYSNYSGQNSEADGEVCFIYRTAEIR